ncbi:MAG: hypothetical protein WD749_15250 [Phycisphaerales bacterium]
MLSTLSLAALAALPTAALAQRMLPPAPSRPAEPAAASPAPPTEAPPAPARPPTLDELLGITPDKAPPAGRPPAVDPARAELERQLTPKEAADQFKQAVDLMVQTADRLQASKDTGLSTQRIQEDIIRKLDMVIHSAQQQEQQSRQRSRQRPQPSDPSQGQPQPQQGQPQDASQSSESTATEPPGRQEGPLGPDSAARGAAWGDLPDRAREALLQGNADRYSDMYRKWTEAYYRKLAEEANR